MRIKGEEKMAFCKFCGGQLPENANNCPNCGAAVEDKQQQYQQNSSQQGGFMGADNSMEFDPADLDRPEKWSFFLAYLWILFFLPLVVCPDSKVGRFHANQGLLLLIFSAAVSVAAGIIGALGSIPFLGGVFSVIGGFLGSAGALVHLALFIVQLINIVNKKAVELPIIGKYRILK